MVHPWSSRTQAQPSRSTNISIMFSKLSSFAIAALAMPLAAFGQQIVTYHGYASTVSCSGDNFQCTDGGAVCCSFPTGFRFSSQWDNVPAGTQGQGYTNEGCASFLFSVFGPGTQCWKGAGGARAASVNWFHSKTGKREESDAKDCVPPTSFNYEVDGVSKSIAISSIEEAHKIGELYIAGNLTALESFPKCA